MVPVRSVLLAAALASAGRAAADEPTHHHHAHRETHHHATGRVEHRASHHGATHHEAVRHAPVAAPPVVAAPAKPVPPPAPPVGTVTGLPLPRFASLRSDEVNLRNGPGTRYPIQWVYKRRDLPVEIEREYDVWRLVKLQDGTEGWVHQATLIGDRTFLVLGAPAANGAAAGDLAEAQTMRAAAAANATPLAYLKPGVIGRVVSCPAGSDWCRVQARGIGGFLPRSAMWGLLPGEVVASH